MRLPCLLISFLFTSALSYGQNLAERMGHPNNAKMLIVHADDMGVAHSVNAATIIAYEKQAITSGSIMVPCPWFDEIAQYFLEHPQHDYGLHLTLTNEWKYYNWDGVAEKSEIPSLLNGKGYLYDNTTDVVKYGKIKEIEIELRAQIDRALSSGLKPSHLDSHMGVLYQTPELISLLFRLSKEYGIPAMYSAARLPAGVVGPKLDYGLTSIYGIPATTPGTDWALEYNKHIKNLAPGLHEIIIHLAYDDRETQAMTVGFEGWHAAWRQRDLDYVTSKEFSQLLKAEEIVLVNWRQIQQVLTE